MDLLHQYLQRLAAYTAYRGSRLLKRTPAPLRHYAAETLVHEPASKGSYPPPITLDGQIERATGTFNGPLETAIKYATQIEQSHKETLLYKIDNVVIDNGFLYAGNKAEYISSLGSPRLNSLIRQKIGTLSSTSSGSIYFGDWVITDNLLEGIANELNLPPIKIIPHKNYAHLPDINKILNLSKNYVNEPVLSETLIIPDDIGYNNNKVKRLQNLRKKYSTINHCNSSCKKLVYLKRGVSGEVRSLINEVEIIEHLQSVGFNIVDPSQLKVDEIIEVTDDSDVVIGIEGSQLCFGLLGLKESGYMITLQPPYRFQSSWRPRCESVGVRWGFLIGIENNQGFEIPLEDVKRLLEKMI